MYYNHRARARLKHQIRRDSSMLVISFVTGNILVFSLGGVAFFFYVLKFIFPSVEPVYRFLFTGFCWGVHMILYAVATVRDMAFWTAWLLLLPIHIWIPFEIRYFFWKGVVWTAKWVFYYPDQFVLKMTDIARQHPQYNRTVENNWRRSARMYDWYDRVTYEWLPFRENFTRPLTILLNPLLEKLRPHIIIDKPKRKNRLTATTPLHEIFEPETAQST